jgi:hypothetical protein
MEQLDSLRRDILPYTTLDGYASVRENHQYTVRSIYFDTPRFTAYREKVEGVKVRKKLRIRSYNEEQTADAVFLEIKSKVNQQGMKQRAQIPFDRLSAFFDLLVADKFIPPGPNHEVWRDNAERFLFHYIHHSLKPVVLVTYEREAYVGRFDWALRVTFDKHLRFLPLPKLTELFQDNELKHIAPRFFVLEIKFHGGFAPWLQSVVNKHGLIRTSISKYGSCVAASGILHPSSPHTLSSDQQLRGMRWKKEVRI